MKSLAMTIVSLTKSRSRVELIPFDQVYPEVFEEKLRRGPRNFQDQGFSALATPAQAGSQAQPESPGNNTSPNLWDSPRSNLFREKSILVFLEAAKLVVRTHDNMRFKIAGAWTQQESQTQSDALRLISDNSQEERVEFKGVVLNEPKEEFFLTTDIFVFPSWIDSFGMVNIEAMAAGCPVIATKSGGAIGEIVVEGETGLLVEK